MLTVTAPKFRLTFPSSWEEVTLLQFQQLAAAEGNQRSVLRALCSDPDKLRLLPDETADIQILEQLPFLGTLPENLFTPTYIPELKIDGKLLHVPKDINLESLAQRWELDDWIEELMATNDDAQESERQLDMSVCAVPLLSIYLSPLVSGQPFTDIEQAKAITPLVEVLPVTLALPLAAFFLSKKQRQTVSGKLSFSISYPEQARKSWPLRWFRSWMPRFTGSIRR